jgi:tetratricopeptide (TPR) repeat protein
LLKEADNRRTKKPQVEEAFSAVLTTLDTKKQPNSTPKPPMPFVSKNKVCHKPPTTLTKGKEAGQALEKAARMQLKTDEKDDAANTLVESYKAYRRIDPDDAARVLKQAISLFTGKGNFRRAAGYQFNLAELYEESDHSVEALDAYDSAAEWYASDQADAYVL